MIFATDEEAINFIKANQSVPKWVTDARTYSADLNALLNGEKFTELLITKIEHIESDKKRAVREKYARPIVDCFERLLLPIQNVFSSTGGTKNYMGGEYRLSQANQKKLLELVSNVRDGKSVERYIEDQYINRYHDDPAGVQWMRYTTDGSGVTSIYPTYQGIGTIRTYIPKGQLVDVILYEPVPNVTKGADGKEIADGSKVWILVDDLTHRVIIQRGNEFALDIEKTFEHPFGQVPVIINSNLTDKYGKRLSPIHKVIELSKEFARDQSVKTIYKFLQGFPKHGRAAMVCNTCHGTKKNGGVVCTDCDGKGEYMKVDVADEMILPFDEDGKFPTPIKDLMGYASPDLETWKQYNDELELLEQLVFKTLWGILEKEKVVKTATEIHYDTQPQIQKLNKYADVVEWVEWTFTEWIANAIDLGKDRKKSVSLIVYGRRYILEGIDTIQEKYESAKEAGENNVVLDSLFDELLVVKFKNDPQVMAQELKKARVEPYLHLSIEQVNTIFGAQEAARKTYFQKWFKNLDEGTLKKEPNELQDQFDVDFEEHLKKIKFVDTTDDLGKIPLALQQIALAADRAQADGDTEMANGLRAKMKLLSARLVEA